MTALEHFEKLLEFETDCWDVHEDLKSPAILIASSWMSAARKLLPPATSPEPSTCPTAKSSSATSPHFLPASPSWSTAAPPLERSG